MLTCRQVAAAPAITNSLAKLYSTADRASLTSWDWPAEVGLAGELENSAERARARSAESPRRRSARAPGPGRGRRGGVGDVSRSSVVMAFPSSPAFCVNITAPEIGAAGQRPMAIALLVPGFAKRL